MASFNKIPGFRKISGYEQYVKMGPGILMTQSQMTHIVERISQTFPELGNIRERVLFNNPPTVGGLLKDSLFVNMKKDSSRIERL